ncbi:MAG: CoA pyrophosphatase [Candidatus Kapabacteria bacterium]|nr:CoA pyrophosphatase [Candidatus Kapabacteria bacterium]
MLSQSHFNEFIYFLIDRLKQELPGQHAHLKLAPKQDGKPFRGFKPPDDARKSAVLAILSENKLNNDIDLLFTLRSSELDSHSGQISFPGGRQELGETPEQNALRETYEEIGIPSEYFKVIGKLTELYVPPSKSVISPIVAFIEEFPDLKINSFEVEDVFKLTLTELSHPDSIKTEIWNFQGQDIEVPLWRLYPRAPLWGATAIMVSELIELYKEFIIR